MAQAALEDPPQPLALLGALQFVVHRIDVDGKLALFEQKGERVLVGGNHRLGIDLQPLRQCLGKLQSLSRPISVVALRDACHCGSRHSAKPSLRQ